MSITRRRLLGAVAGASGLAGCAVGGDSSDSQTTTTTTSVDSTPTDEETTETTAELTTVEATTTETTPTLRIDTHPDLGDILVDAEGMVLYMFDQDSQGADESACYDSCAEAWPPLIIEEDPTAGDDVTTSLDTFEREDRQRQVTANGWPVYYFASDEEPGDATGQGANDVWWVLAPDGSPVRSTSGDDEESAGTTAEEHDHAHDVEVIDSPSQDAEIAMRSEDGHHFEPHLVWIELGGTVTWTTESGTHTTTAYYTGVDKPARIPNGADGWDSGLLEEDQTHVETFNVAGVYDYYCKPHEGVGMVGSILVGDPDPHAQPALEPPQDELPAAAQELLSELNEAANATLGHTHD